MKRSRFDLSGVWRQGARRSLVLALAGASLGAAFAGYGLMRAHGDGEPVPPEDAAVVNSVPVLMTDYTTQLQHPPLSQKRQVLNQMIGEELTIQRAIDLRAYAVDPDVRAAIVGSVDGQATLEAMTGQPTEAELRAWQGSHPDVYASEGRMTLRDWIISGHEKPDILVAALKAGASPDQLGLRSSGKVDDGEELYFAARIHLGDTLFDQARRLRDGEISAPIQQTDGVHILAMIRNIKPEPQTFEAARQQIFSDVLADRAARLSKGNLQFLKDRADIRLAPEVE